jgi:VanZ family protein
LIEQRKLHPAFDSRLARWLAVAGWMMLIFFLSSQPRLPSPPDPLVDLLFKKSAHFTAYAVLAVLMWRALPPGRRIWALAWFLTVLYASSDEWHQSFVPNRHPSPWDVVIDALGAAVGLLVYRRMLRRAQTAGARVQANADSDAVSHRKETLQSREDEV